MMDFLIDTLFVVFCEMMLQQTMHNIKYNWNEQTIHLYLAFKKSVCVLFFWLFLFVMPIDFKKHVFVSVFYTVGYI